MALLTEEQIKKLKIDWKKFPIVEDSCIWCWACVAISPDVFEIDDQWRSVVLELDDYKDKSVDDSINACPVASIKWWE